MSVTPNDVAVELGRPAPMGDQAVQWASWISQALFLIGRRLGNVALLDQEAVDYVVLQAVAAHVRKPEDVTQVDVKIDDGSVTKRYASGSGRVAILDEWWDLMTPDGVGSPGAFTISPAGAVDRVGDGPSWFVR